MASLKDQIEDLAGGTAASDANVADTAYLATQLINGCKDIVRKISIINPSLIPMFTQEYQLTDDNGFDIMSKIVSNTDTTVDNAAEISASAGSIVVASGAEVAFNAGDYITIGTDPEIMLVTSTADSLVYVTRGMFGTTPVVHVVTQSIFKITSLGTDGKIFSVFRRDYTQDDVYVDRFCEASPFMISEFVQDSDSLFYQSKYYPAYTQTGSKVFIYPNGFSKNTTKGSALGLLNIVQYGNISNIATETYINRFPQQMQDIAVLYAAIRLKQAIIEKVNQTLTAVGTTLDLSGISLPAAPSDLDLGTLTVSTSLPTYDGPSEHIKETSISIDNTPTFLEMDLPPSPELSWTLTSTLSAISIPDNVTLPSLDIGDPAALNALTALPDMPAPNTNSNFTYLTIGDTASDPSSVSFPSVPVAPTMEGLPSFPVLDEDYSSISATVTTGITGTVDAGTAPTFDDYEFDTQFQAEWDDDGSDSVSSWGLDTNGSPTHTGFEKMMLTEEDTEMAQLRLSQYKIELEKFTSKNNVLSKVFATEMEGYVQKIRGEVAKIQGQAQVTQAEASTVQAQAGIIQGEVAANKAKIDAYTAEIQAKVGKFASEIGATVNLYTGQINGLTKQYASESQHEIQKFTTSAQKQLQEYQAEQSVAIKEYESNLQAYGIEYKSVIEDWMNREFRVKFQKWQLESQTKIAKYQADLGAVIQAKAQEIGMYNNQEAAQVRKYGAELQKVSAENQSKIASWNMNTTSSIQKYTAERDYKISNWRMEHQLEAQKYQLDIQSGTSSFQANVQRALGEFNANLGKYSSDLQTQVSSKQLDSKEFESNLAKYQAELGKYQAEVGKEVNKWSAELQAHSIKTQQISAKYQWHVNNLALLKKQYEESFVPYQMNKKQPQGGEA